MLVYPNAVMEYFEPIKESLLSQRREIQDRILHLEREEGGLVKDLEEASEAETLAWQADVVSTRAVMKQHSVRLLKEIEQSLLRFEQGTYGTCSKCLKQISQSRLQVIPTTQLCQTCI